MAVALRLVVAVVVVEVGVVLGAMVVRKLQQTLALATLAGLVLVAQEVQREAVVLHGVNQRHAQHVLVEIERLLRILDTNHRAA